MNIGDIKDGYVWKPNDHGVLAWHPLDEQISSAEYTPLKTDGAEITPPNKEGTAEPSNNNKTTTRLGIKAYSAWNDNRDDDNNART